MPRPLAVLFSLVSLVSLGFSAVPGAGPVAPPSNPVAGGRWLAGDLHVHTTYSHDAYGGPDDTNTGPDEAYTAGWSVGQQFDNAASRGLDFLAITDHNDVRSQADDGFGASGVIPIRAYENSLDGHAQMLGADHIYDVADLGNDGRDARDIAKLAKELRKDGGLFQINHPGSADPADPDHPDWGYGHEVVPETVEVWNITRGYQPPFPSASSNDRAIVFWERFLDAGEQVGATGGSDNHYVSTAGAQGVGQPTTWVYATDATEAGLLAAMRAGRTTISAQPPALGGARLFLEADADGDGTYEAMVGDTVATGTPMRVRTDNAAPGAYVRIVTTGGVVAQETTIGAPAATVAVDLDGPVSWVRAELLVPEAVEVRRDVCDPVVGDQTTYCREEAALLAMTSPIYVDTPNGGGSTYADIDQDGDVRLGNGIVERRWSAAPFETTAIEDRRTGVVTGSSPDLRLTLPGGQELTSRDLELVDVDTQRLDRGGLRLTMTLAPAAGALLPDGRVLTGTVTREVTVFPGIAGFETRTTVALPVAFSGYSLDEVAVGSDAAATAQAFNAGYDWRGSDTPDWEPQVDTTGSAHTGDHRVTTTGAVGEPIDASAQWLSVALDEDRDARAFVVAQRVNYDSTHVGYDGATAGAHVDLADDLVYLGPFEGEIHTDNPTPAPVRLRTAAPDRPLTLETAFLGFATDADDEPWQHDRYLREQRWRGWRVGEVTFNSNGVDTNRISTGAKDDMDLAEVERQAAVARRLGVETFILDDGWQAASGDWCPDSADCPEPRGMFPDRFPDDEFRAVRGLLAGEPGDEDDMRLGLWMSPMHFNPGSDAYQDNPEWACTPLGDGLAGYTALQPDSGSNEAGLGTWNPLARSLGATELAGSGQRLIDHIESRIARAITTYGSDYFKFDFLAWIDCVDRAGDGVDAYEYREAFVAMLDRLGAAYPDVTFQIDETNDYRLFPFESVARGPSWYANGSPTVDQALHNLWLLAPYVPGATLGQDALGRDRRRFDVGYVMAAALGSHITFFDDLPQLETEIGADGIAEARRWIDLYTRERDRFTSMAYPLLDDPLGGSTWTALQPWDLDAQRGALMVFRQDADGDERLVPLRGIVGDGSYVLREALTGATVGTFPAEELRAGVTVALPDRNSAAVYLIDPTSTEFVPR